MTLTRSASFEAFAVAKRFSPSPRNITFTGLAFAVGSWCTVWAWHAFWLRRNRGKYRLYRRQAVEACGNAMDELEEEGEEGGEDDEREVLQMDVGELLEKLRSGEVTSVRAVRAYLRKALGHSAGRGVNCVTQPVPGVLEHAARCDELLESGNKAGLLQGLPVSIKENIGIGGMRSHWGVSSQCGGVVDDDSAVVKVLKSHGAVPFVKTNVPQTLYSFECSNPVYGVTRNPHDSSRGPGGSSGGEAALMAVGGSLLGIGTDVAGSTRIPAAFCGVVGFKPTMGRLSTLGSGTTLRGLTGVGKTLGPQAQTVAGCRLLMQALCCELMCKLDPTVTPVPFEVERCTQERTLRIGYYDDDGFFPATPAYRRAVKEARNALARRGHELIAFTPPNVERAMQLYYGIVGGDGGKTLCDVLRHDDKDVAIRHLVRLSSRSGRLTNLFRPLVRLLWPRSGHTLCQAWRRHADELWALLDARQAYVLAFAAAWERLGLDGVICPPHAMGAPPLGECAKMACSFSYTMLYNLLDFPAGVVPVTTVSTVDELALRHHPQNNYWDQLVAGLSVGSSGLPVGVQCATLRWHDETCLYLMQELETAVKEGRPE